MSPCRQPEEGHFVWAITQRHPIAGLCQQRHNAFTGAANGSHSSKKANDNGFNKPLTPAWTVTGVKQKDKT